MKQYTNVAKYGNKFIIRGVDTETKERFTHKSGYSPTLYLKDSNGTQKTLLGVPVSPMHFDTIKGAQSYIYDMAGVQPIYGQTNLVQQFIADEYSHISDGFDITLINTIVFDIETAIPDDGSFPVPDKANEEILLITACNLSTKKVVTFGCKPFNKLTIDCDHLYVQCKDEVDLLKRFIKYINDENTDIITGWYSDNFDIPYTYNRIEKVLGADKLKYLSPNRNTYVSKRGDINISGITIIDSLDLYKKYTMGSREEWNLAFIAEYEEVPILKQDYSDLEGGMRELYEKHWDRYVNYNVGDVMANVGIIEKNSLFDILCTIAYIANQNFSDSVSPVRTWENLIYNHINQMGVVLDTRIQNAKSDYDGAYVMEPTPSLYKWVGSIDATGLYPSIQTALNISPETIIGKLDGVNVDSCLRMDQIDGLPDGVAVAANGLLIDKTRDGIVPTLIRKFMTLRKQAKGSMLDYESKAEIEDTTKYDKLITQLNAVQLAYKTLNNSEYGSLANAHFLYYNLNAAEAITLSGQFVIKYVSNSVENNVQEKFGTKEPITIYIDTDSVYINLQPFVDTLPDGLTIFQIEEHAREFMSGYVNDISNFAIGKVNDYLNVYNRSSLNFKLEKICMSALWSAKKRYALNVLSSEGVIYTAPKVKVTGLEIVRSSTPKVAKTYLRDAVDCLLHNDIDGFHARIAEAKRKFDVLPIEEISSPRGVSDIDKYTDGTTYAKGCPIQCRAAILHNQLLLSRSVVGVRRIVNENKIKFVYLRMPNPIMENVIGYIGKLPPEFGLHDFVDRDTQFEKVFLSPIEKIAKIANVSTGLETNLFSFFE